MTSDRGYTVARQHSMAKSSKPEAFHPPFPATAKRGEVRSGFIL